MDIDVESVNWEEGSLLRPPFFDFPDANWVFSLFSFSLPPSPAALSLLILPAAAVDETHGNFPTETPAQHTKSLDSYVHSSFLITIRIRLDSAKMYSLLLSLSLMASAAVGVLAADSPEFKIDVTQEVVCDRKTKSGDGIQVHYRGTLADNGNQFDSSTCSSSPLI